MKNTNNTIIEATATEIKFPTNGNCKRVKNLTTGAEYGSITETAIVLETTMQAVSHAIINKHLCKGNKLILLKDLHDSIDEVCDEAAKANRRAAKAYARAEKEARRADKLATKMTSMEEEMAEFRAWKAEQEEKRKAEEAKRKEEEKRQALIAKKREQISKYEDMRKRKMEQVNSIDNKIMQVEMELEALIDAGKEVE